MTLRTIAAALALPTQRDWDKEYAAFEHEWDEEAERLTDEWLLAPEPGDVERFKRRALGLLNPKEQAKRALLAHQIAWADKQDSHPAYIARGPDWTFHALCSAPDRQGCIRWGPVFYSRNFITEKFGIEGMIPVQISEGGAYLLVRSGPEAAVVANRSFPLGHPFRGEWGYECLTVWPNGRRTGICITPDFARYIDGYWEFLEIHRRQDEAKMAMLQALARWPLAHSVWCIDPSEIFLFSEVWREGMQADPEGWFGTPLIRRSFVNCEALPWCRWLIRP